MNKREHPVAITADKNERALIIEWADEHTSRYPFGLLRAACPCATCRGGHENMRSEPDADVFDRPLPESPRTRLRKIDPVGSYGLTIEWEDGHHFGIYNWHFLRALCPCEICRTEAASLAG